MESQKHDIKCLIPVFRSNFKLKFPDNFEDEEYAGEEIDKENYSALTPIKSDAKSQYKKFTFGDFLGKLRLKTVTECKKLCE